LVLSRRLGEELVIGESIRVSIVAASGDRVRIGVTAPTSVTVDREEVHEKRTQQKLAPPCRFQAPANDYSL
jgi:carbon storage regulator